MKHFLIAVMCASMLAGGYVAAEAGHGVLTTPDRQSRVADRFEKRQEQQQRQVAGVTDKESIRHGKVLRGKRLPGTSSSPSPVHIAGVQMRSVGDVPADKARITLDVVSDWGDGSGYQLLLDPDCILFFLRDSGHVDQIYSEADYKIPADAYYLDGFLTAGQSGSVDVPEGEYDFLLFNPTPSYDALYIPGGTAEGDDVYFVGGHEYVFTITMVGNADNCTVTSDSSVDLGVTAIKSPASGLDLTAAEPVTINVANAGTAAVTSFTVSYTINGGSPVSEVVDRTLAPGESFDYTFAAKADMSAPGNYAVKAAVKADGDVMGVNDKLVVDVQHLQPWQPPYNCTFEEADDEDEWIVIDANEDDYTWGVEYYGEGIGFATLYYSNYMIPSDDYIVLKSPVSLKKGENHVEVVYNGFAPGYTEKMALLYGTTPDVAEMQVLQRFEGFTATDEGFTSIVNFTVPADGIYYFAFHGYSDADQAGVMLNEVTIDEGKYVGAPDLSIDRISLPFSSCSLGDGETISVTVSNKGTAGITSFVLDCTVNGTSIGKETVSTPIPAGSGIDVQLQARADFSAVDSYAVVVRATDVVPDDGQNPETVTTNNIITGSVTHFTPVDVPFTTSFADESQRGWWSSSDGSSWTFDDWYSAYYCTGTSPLVSRGINLKAGSAYSVDYNYMAGQYFWSQTYDQYDILCGLDGTDPSTWEVIYKSDNEYTDDWFADKSIPFRVPTDGVYCIAFRQTYPVGTFCLASISVTELTDYDISVSVPAGLPTMIPQEQLSGLTVDVTVSNKGRMAVSGKVTLSINGIEAGTTTFATLESVGEVCVSVPVADGVLTSGQVKITAAAEIDGQEDANPADNTATTSTSVELTDGILGYDRVGDTYEEQAIGADNGSYMVVGLPVRINAATYLSGFELGWSDADAKVFDMYVYSFDPTVPADEDGFVPVGELLKQESANKGDGPAVTSYMFAEPLPLAHGCYMLGVGYEGYGLAVDMIPPSNLFSIESVGGSTMAYDYSNSNFGTPALRAIVDEKAAVAVVGDGGSGAVEIWLDGTTLTVATDGGCELTGIDICSLAGVSVCSQAATGTLFTYGTESLAGGIYIVKVGTTSGTAVKKLVVK